MYIVGDRHCQIVVAQPRVPVIALYLRDACGLHRSDDLIPLLDPPCSRWPAWAHPVAAPAEPQPPVDREAARTEWFGWWNRLLATDARGEATTLHPPAFPELRPAPQLRRLLQWHYPRAESWTDAICDDPRTSRALVTPRRPLTELIKTLESQPDRIPAAFCLRLTVLPVAAKHAWPLADDYILISQTLLADTDNFLDWLQPRANALAWREGHITLTG